MALSIRSQDIINFPGTSKTINIDLTSVVPISENGDEINVLSIGTSAYSKVGTNQRIQDMYITDFVGGWAKSSGFPGSAGKFSIDSTHNRLKIKMDTTVSGIDGSGYYEVALDYNSDDTPIDGEAVADDLANKIHALADVLDSADVGFTNAYRSAEVIFKNGKFWVASGSVGKFYTGNYRSSVSIIAATTNDCSKILGFDLGTSSQKLSTISVKETVLNTDYTAGADTLSVNTGTGAMLGLAYMITDNIHTEYFTTISGTTDSQLKVATVGNNSYDALKYSYTAYETKLQLLKEQDPEGKPVSWYNSIDALVKYGIKTMANQIDYSTN